MSVQSCTIRSVEMATKKKLPTPSQDGLDIPGFLERTGNETTPAAPAAAPTPAPKAKGIPFHVPKGMTEEEYNKKKQELDPPKPAAEPKAPKKEKAKRPERPSDTFTLAELARENKEDPRMYRRIARANKKAFAALFVNGMKYVFKLADKAKVVALVREGLAKETKAKVKPATTTKPVDPVDTKAAPGATTTKALQDVKKPAAASKKTRQDDDATQAHQDARLAAAKEKASRPKKSKFAKK